MHGNMTCAGAADAIEDPRFAEDEFTRQALVERRTVTAHAHAKGLLATVLGTLAFLGIPRAFVRAVR